MSGKAVLVIDMLNDFVKGSMKNKRASKIVSPLRSFSGSTPREYR